MIARFFTRLRELANRPPSPRGNAAINLNMPIYVRSEQGRTITLEIAPQASASWATTRALIVLDDPRDPTQCRLLRRGKPLRPRRSLQVNGVQHGDTLDLIPADAVPRPRRLSELLRLRTGGSKRRGTTT